MGRYTDNRKTYFENRNTYIESILDQGLEEYEL